MPRLNFWYLWKQWAERLFVVLLLYSVLGCASYAGRDLQRGVAGYAEVVQVMGIPAMEWQDADGSRQLSYPRGPEGPHSFMVFIGPDDRLKKIDNVLNDRHYALIVPGKTTQAEILRLLGPPTPQWTSYFEARDEYVWEWLACDPTGFMIRFDVLFNGREGAVRSTMARPDYRGPDGAVPPCGPLP